MTATYPGGVKSFTPKTDNVDDVMAVDVNEIQEEVAAIETALGANLANALTQAIIQASQLANEVMNWPSLEKADNVQPEWWEVSADATLTEVDVAGEGITETYARALKVVTTGDGKYAYQRHTYADQPRAKAGRALSAIVAVWSVGGIAARIRLQSSVGSLGVSSDTTAAGWTILTVENKTLDGTYVDLYCEADTGTAYFVPLGVNIGDRAVPLPPRALVYRGMLASVTAHSLNGSGGQARSDLDLSAVTSNLAAMLNLQSILRDSTGTNEEWGYHVYPNGFAAGAAQECCRRGWIQSSVSRTDVCAFVIQCDDGQVIEDELTKWSGTTVETCSLYLIGYWEWA